MSAQSFIEYAQSANLSGDEIYTIELLIETARSHTEEGYYSTDHQKRAECREQPDYAPSFPNELIASSAEHLAGLDWLSLQRTRGKERPVRSLEPIRHLTELTGLSLGNNEIVNLEPLKGCTKLKRLIINQNAVQDTSPLAFCSGLEDLEICENPVDSFSGLDDLLKLKELAISAGQLPSFSDIKSLPALSKLNVDSDWFDSFMAFPDLPRLKVIQGAHVRSLSGIEKFTNLENIINMWGEFSSLEPLRGLRKLTHVNILESKIRQLEPMSELLALRAIHISTSEASVDFSSLYRLPALHELTVRAQDEAPPELIKFCDELSSWDTEFYSPQCRHEPSLEIEIVDQKTFDFYDSKCGYGIVRADTNEGLLSSELSWLDERLEAVLQVEMRITQFHSTGRVLDPELSCC